MGEQQQDQSFDRLLRRSLSSDGRGEVSPGCVDAEQLASWVSGALSPVEAATVEQHVATCQRCESMLALFARTEPPVAPTPSLWQRWQVRWLVPLATAAIVAAILVAIPGRDVLREPSPMEPRAEPELTGTPQRLEAPAAPPVAIDERRQADARQPARDAQADRQPAADRGEASRATSPAPGDTRAPVESRQVRPPAPTAKTEAAAPVTPQEPQPRPAPEVQERVAATAERPALQETVATFRTAALTEFVSPGGEQRWRILPAGEVERSTDGVSWEALNLPPPAGVTAGHSPARSVAWLVGRGGVIYVAADTSVLRVPFVETADLISVTATNDREATVTTADGRRFHTTDRGVTWRRR